MRPRPDGKGPEHNAMGPRPDGNKQKANTKAQEPNAKGQKPEANNMKANGAMQKPDANAANGNSTGLKSDGKGMKPAANTQKADSMKARVDRMGRQPDEMGPRKGDGIGPDDGMGPRKGDGIGPDDGMGPDGGGGRPGMGMFFGPVDIMNTVLLILLFGMNIGVKLFFKSDKDKQEMKELQKKNLEQQLEYLKYQINPHFFMNTLNNIHALVDIEPEQAKATIVDLSHLMRYVLYEGSNELVPLGRDIDFMQNYISLMRLRYSDKVKINVNLPEAIPDYQIPPMMLITFVENAFKHGVSYKKDSFIDIDIKIEDERLHFCCKNSKNKRAEETTPHEGGVGLTNVKQRLDLLFGEDYKLDIDDADETYTVNLNIPFNTKKQYD
ncbi:MAG: histidine kinase [Prevotella sp.]|nr:histidine kinase [Prevotella sp.]